MAEVVVFGDDHKTTGCSSDLDAAERIAHGMVLRYGPQGKSTRSFFFRDDGEPTAQTKAAIDLDVRRTLDEVGPTDTCLDRHACRRGVIDIVYFGDVCRRGRGRGIS